MTNTPLNKIDECILDGWTIFDHPTDYPDHFVARRWVAARNGATIQTQDVMTSKHLDELRGALVEAYPDLTRLSRMPGDEPHIIEVWI